MVVSHNILKTRPSPRHVASCIALICVAIFGMTACQGEKRPKPGTVRTIDGNSKSTGSSTHAQTTAATFPTDQATTKVDVSLVDYAIFPKPTSAAGPNVLFTVTNNAVKDAHEMAVTKPGATSEEGAYATTEAMGPGQTKTLAVVLKPGEYQLACYLPGPDGKTHYQMGMFTQFTVT